MLTDSEISNKMIEMIQTSFWICMIIIKLIQCYFLIKEINNNIINQTRVIHYKSTHLSRILKYCKNDQILESCYQQQEKMLRQKKYKYKQINIIWNIDFSN